MATSPAPALHRGLESKAFAAPTGTGTPAKAIPRSTVKVSAEGIVRAIVAVTGVVDHVGDLIIPRAFTETLLVRRPKVVDDHEWGNRAGRTLHIEEWLPGDKRLPKTTKDGKPWPAEAGALVATMQYNLFSERGRESYEWVRFYAESNEAEFSIGYKVPPGAARKRSDGVRLIIKIDLYELSHVLFGAASQTMALEVKNFNGATAGTLERPALATAENVNDDDDDEDQPLDPKVKDNTPWEDEAPTGLHASMECKSALSVVAEAKALLAAADYEVKSARMKGSWEEVTDLVRCAALDLLNAAGDTCYEWVDVVATYPNEALVRAYPKGGGEESAYLIPYVYDEAEGGVALDAAEPIQLELVAVPSGGNPDAAAEVMAEGPAVAVLADLARVGMAAGLESKVGRAVRQQLLDLAASLSGKSAAPPDPEPIVPPADDPADAPDLDADPADAPAAPPADDPGDYPIDGDDLPDDVADDAPEGDGSVYSADNLPDGSWHEFRKTQPIEAMRMSDPFEVETREGRVKCSDGWLAIDSEGYPYPIAAAEFDLSYEPTGRLTDAPDAPEADPQAPDDQVAMDPGEQVDPAAEEPPAPMTEDLEQKVVLDPDEHFALMDELREALTPART